MESVDKPTARSSARWNGPCTSAPLDDGGRGLRTFDVAQTDVTTPRQIAEVNKKNGSSTDDWIDDDCDHVSINGGGELKRCDCDVDDTAPLADVGQRPTKSRRLDADAPTSSMGVRPVAAASDIAEKDGGDTMADDHFHGVSDVTRFSVTLSWPAPTPNGGAAMVACVIGRRERLSPTCTRVA